MRAFFGIYQSVFYSRSSNRLGARFLLFIKESFSRLSRRLLQCVFTFIKTFL